MTRPVRGRPTLQPFDRVADALLVGIEVGVERPRLWAGIALVLVAPLALWGLFVGALLLGASGGALFMPALVLGAPSWVAYRLARVVLPPRDAA